jgi:MFS superfamily sulfate permease-like transporter
MYAVFGSSPQLSVGPVAVTSLLVNTGVSNMLPVYNAAYIPDPDDPPADYVSVLHYPPL